MMGEDLPWESVKRVEKQKDKEVGDAPVDQSLTPLALAESLQNEIQL